MRFPLLCQGVRSCLGCGPPGTWLGFSACTRPCFICARLGFCVWLCACARGGFRSCGSPRTCLRWDRGGLRAHSRGALRLWACARARLRPRARLRRRARACLRLGLRRGLPRARLRLWTCARARLWPRAGLGRRAWAGLCPAARRGRGCPRARGGSRGPLRPHARLGCACLRLWTCARARLRPRAGLRWRARTCLRLGLRRGLPGARLRLWTCARAPLRPRAGLRRRAWACLCPTARRGRGCPCARRSRGPLRPHARLGCACLCARLGWRALNACAKLCRRRPHGSLGRRSLMPCARLPHRSLWSSARLGWCWRRVLPWLYLRYAVRAERGTVFQLSSAVRTEHVRSLYSAIDRVKHLSMVSMTITDHFTRETRGTDAKWQRSGCAEALGHARSCRERGMFHLPPCMKCACAW